MKPLPIDPNAHPVPVFNPGTVAPIVVDGKAGSAATVNVINATARSIVRLWANDDCYIKIAATPTATANDIPLSGGVPENFIIEAGCKIAVLNAKLWIIVHQE